MKNKAHLAAFASFFIWGANIALTKYVLVTMPFFILGLLRYGMAAPTFGYKTFESLLHVRGKYAQLLFLKTLLNIIQMAAMFMALEIVDGSFFSIAGLLMPLLVYNLAVRYLHEKNDIHLLIGSLIAVLGSVIATLAVTNVSGTVSILGLILVCVNILADAATTVMTKQLRKKYSGDQLNSMFFSASFVFYFVLTAIMWGQFNFADISQGAWIGSTVLTVFNSIIAMRLYMYSIKVVKATELSLYVYVTPIMGMIASILFLGERQNVLFWAGVGTVIAGILYAERWMKFRVPEFLMHRVHHH